MPMQVKPLTKPLIFWSLLNAFAMGYAICDLVHTGKLGIVFAIAALSGVVQGIYRVKN